GGVRAVEHRADVVSAPAPVAGFARIPVQRGRNSGEFRYGAPSASPSGGVSGRLRKALASCMPATAAARAVTAPIPNITKSRRLTTSPRGARAVPSSTADSGTNSTSMPAAAPAGSGGRRFFLCLLPGGRPSLVFFFAPLP